MLGRPGWLYASDPLSCLPVYWLSFIFPGRVIYHEHDSPVPKNDERFFMKAILSSRSKLARRARLCILPNAERAEIFAGQMGDLKNVICVWNCPSLEELDRSEIKKTDEELQLFYHGTITPIRLPLTVLDAMALLPEKVRLRVVGYQTIGHPDYVDKLKARAASLGLQGRFEAIGAVPSRKELLGLCSLSHIGLAFMPKTTQDINERAMTGASNKPFEYLACGLALLVSNLPDWKGMFADAGFGRACDTDDPRSIADAVRWFLEHPEELKSMSSAGRQKIWDEWNYESQFEAVLRILESQNI